MWAEFKVFSRYVSSDSCEGVKSSSLPHPPAQLLEKEVGNRQVEKLRVVGEACNGPDWRLARCESCSGSLSLADLSHKLVFSEGDKG